MDILSEVLRVVRLSGAVHFRAKFTQPWSVLTSPEGLAARLNLSAGSVTPFHVVVDEGCWVIVEGLPSIRIEAGDVVIFPEGLRHALASDVGLTPVSTKDLAPHLSLQTITVLDYGGGGRCSNVTCGFLHVDQQFDPLLKSLPTVLCVRSRSGKLALETWERSQHWEHPIQNERESAWWTASVRYLISEAETPGPGNRASLARLTETLFLEVLRWQFRYSPPGCGGWPAGLRDPHIGRVLSRIHESPQRPWTVSELAKEAAMSRAALAKRFVELVGESPMQYLAAWRMHLARQLLRESSLGIGEIAGRVGYDSDAAFNRAFRRIVGMPPAAWREGEVSRARKGPWRV